MKLFVLTAFVIFGFINNSKQQSSSRVFRGEGCDQNKLFLNRYKSQIESISPDIRKIINYVIGPKDAGETYESLSYFVDKFGSRLTGTQNLENSIDFMLGWLKKEGHNNVHGENVTVPKWVSFFIGFKKFVTK